MAKKIVAGDVFGKLTVAEFSHRVKDQAYWLCRCECGVEKPVRGGNLQSGNTSSCGCMSSRVIHGGRPSEQSEKHGMWNSSEYKIWEGMIARCYHPSNHSYRKYGAKGIRVCQEWRESFVAFYSHVGPRPSLKHTLDRYPNNDGNYEPGNVRWATWREQINNSTRHRRMIEWRGETLCLVDWCERTGLAMSTITGRLAKGWSTEESLSTPPRHKSPRPK
jgi:hypothetical protein